MYIYASITCYGHRTESVDSRSLVKLLESEGWAEVRQKGSHKQFRHPTKPGLITVPSPKKDIPLGTLRSIARAAGLTLE